MKDVRLIAILLGVLLVIAILSGIGILSSATGLLAQPLAWISAKTFAARVGFSHGVGRGLCPIPQEERELNKQIQQLKQEVTRLKIAESENETLRLQLNFFTRDAQRFVMAHVTGHSSEVIQGSQITLDRGRKDGIAKGLAVTTEDGIIIGKTWQVHETTTQVLLLNDSRSKLLAMSPGRKDGTGIIEGNFGLGITMSLIPITGEIQSGDTLVTSGLEDAIPPGLSIAQVTGLEFKPADLFKTAQLKSMTDYSGVRIVSVLLPKPLNETPAPSPKQ